MSTLPPPGPERRGSRDTSRVDFPHGRTTGYAYGCRCGECKLAQTKYRHRTRTRPAGRPYGAHSCADWLEGQDYDGSEDFGRGFMHAVRLLRGE